MPDQTFKLRDYQENCIGSTWMHLSKEERVLNVLPTAAGKTVIFSALCKKLIEYKPDIKIAILVNKVVLIEQIRETLQYFVNRKVTAYCGSLGEWDNRGQIVIATVQSVANFKRQGNTFLWGADYNVLIGDEYHRLEGTGQFEDLRKEMARRYSLLKEIYFTATPFNKGCELDLKPTFRLYMNELIERGFLVKPILIAPECSIDTSDLKIVNGDFLNRELIERVTDDTQKMIEMTKDALMRTKGRKKVVFACATIDHARSVKSIIEAAGEKCSEAHSKLNDKDYEKNIKAFEEGDVKNIVTVVQLSEGYDYPPVDAIVCFRPTRSATLYVQLLGRGLRLAPGKKDCLFLDYGGVVEALGHPNDPLLARNKTELKEKEIREITCPQCRQVVFYTALFPVKCDGCGYKFKETDKIDRLKNLTKKAYDGKKSGTILPVDSVSVMEGQFTRRGDLVDIIVYRSGIDSYRQYVFLQPDTPFKKKLYWEWKKEKSLIKSVKYIKLNNSGKYVDKRIFVDDRDRHPEHDS